MEKVIQYIMFTSIHFSDENEPKLIFVHVSIKQLLICITIQI